MASRKKNFQLNQQYFLWRPETNLKTTNRLPLLMVLVFIFGLGTVFAQNVNTGEIRGTLTDSSGAVVADVEVTVTNVGTGLVLHTKTGDRGILRSAFSSYRGLLCGFS